MRSPARNWGASDAEVAETYPCDTLVSAPTDRLFRAVTVAADAEMVFRWVCQVKVAPYSYDLIDNRGRRSPQELTPGADNLAVGQRFAVVFTIADYVEGNEITAVTTARGQRLFGRVALTYRVTRLDSHTSRLVVCLVLPYRSAWRRVRHEALACGDLVMMRKQLLNLKSLAESTAAQSGSA